MRKKFCRIKPSMAYGSNSMTRMLLTTNVVGDHGHGPSKSGTVIVVPVLVVMFCFYGIIKLFHRNCNIPFFTLKKTATSLLQYFLHRTQFKGTNLVWAD